MLRVFALLHAQPAARIDSRCRQVLGEFELLLLVIDNCGHQSLIVHERVSYTFL